MTKTKAIVGVQKTALPTKTEPIIAEPEKDEEKIPEWLVVIMKKQNIKKPFPSKAQLELDQIIKLDGQFYKVAKVGINALCVVIGDKLKSKKFANREEEKLFFTEQSNGSNSTTISMKSELLIYGKLINIAEPVVKTKRRAI